MCCLQLLDTARLPLFLSHCALVLLTKKPRLDSTLTLKKHLGWIGAYGEISSSWTAPAKAPVVTVSGDPLRLIVCPSSLGLSLLHIHWQGVSESFALLLLCYKTGGIIVSEGNQPIASPQHQTAPESEWGMLDPSDAATAARILSLRKSRVANLHTEMCPHP